jgi:hypothetical protein
MIRWLVVGFLPTTKTNNSIKYKRNACEDLWSKIYIAIKMG